MKAIIQFIEGAQETTVPTINITRSKDGSTGTATFIFEDPSLFSTTINPESQVSGMYLIDDEGVLSTKDLTANFIAGKPKTLKAIYIMKNAQAWDRFMRFMEKYLDENNLTFIRAE
uniref:Photosystem II reaction center Psb28 protein n=1 Tax=Pleurocladia lacustris TaxID=246121 RepID=A0A1I9LVI6_9PHAE|nr:photosystem II reaction center protein W [Pleurocladia lacustris]ANS57606.1 photosystem II reaction center protein W [Pleurocladia lacustris]ANS57750.1 photosystem II reaction center protein W [Pleurocladia lacustris]